VWKEEPEGRGPLAEVAAVPVSSESRGQRVAPPPETAVILGAMAWCSLLYPAALVPLASHLLPGAEQSPRGEQSEG